MSSVQRVLMASRAFHRWTAATELSLVTVTGKLLDSSVDYCTRMLICSSSTVLRNSMQWLECSDPSAVSALLFYHCLSVYAVPRSLNPALWTLCRGSCAHTKHCIISLSCVNLG